RPGASWRGRRNVPALLAALEGLRAHGVAPLDRAAEALVSRGARSGIAVVLSDLLDDGRGMTAARRLAAARHDTTVIQVLAAEELDPGIRGEATLVDSETGETLDLS